MNLLVRQYFNFLLLLLIFTIVYMIRFCDVIQTIIKYEKKVFSSGGSTLQISIKRGFTLEGGSNFFLRKSCLKSDSGILRGE